jgi:hypothetical protein
MKINFCSRENQNGTYHWFEITDNYNKKSIEVNIAEARDMLKFIQDRLDRLDGGPKYVKKEYPDSTRA